MGGVARILRDTGKAKLMKLFLVRTTVDILTGEGVTDPLGILPSGVCEPVVFFQMVTPPVSRSQ